MECEAKHQHHKNCQITIDDRECCPHCGLSSSSSRNVYIEMQLSSRPTFLPVQTVIELVLITIISNLPSKTYPLFFICLLNIQYFFATFFICFSCWQSYETQIILVAPFTVKDLKYVYFHYMSNCYI